MEYKIQRIYYLDLLKVDKSLLFTLILGVYQRIYQIYELLTDIVITPDIIAISETKLNNNSNYNDIQLPGYTFVNKNSLTQAGGVGIYVKISLIYKIRSDLDLHNDHIEDMWKEVTDFKHTSFQWVHYTPILIKIQSILEKSWKLVWRL